MPLCSVNMAVPVKEHIRESQIYFLSSSENVPQGSRTIEKKYLIFKTFELIVALCALMLFAYGMRATKNEIEDMLKYITLGGVTIYPLLFVLLSVNIKERPLICIVSNISATIALLAIGGTTFFPSHITAERHFHAADKEKYFETLMQLRSSFLLIINGCLYFVETLMMCYEIIKLYFDNNCCN